ncbi:hypothetical protein K8R30_03510 [archaeon]|nr:hypothetical protein [archaeon]
MEKRIYLDQDEYSKCKDFSEQSAKTQRETRSGGSDFRTVYLIEQDTMRGKVAEVLVKKFLEQGALGFGDISLDFEIYPRGKWDDQDIILNNKNISIKSAKWFSNWLLLESKDIVRGDVYDYYIFVTVDKDNMAGNIRGFVRRIEILECPKTYKIKKGNFIPNTRTVLDADNHARHASDMNNIESDWIEFVKEVNN